MENRARVTNALRGSYYGESPDEHVDPSVIFTDSIAIDSHNWCQGNRAGLDAELVRLKYDGVEDVDAEYIAEE